MRISGILVFAVIASAASGCAPDPYSNLDGPRKYFDENKIGTSPDYAIVKFGNINDHVATVHGSADDLATCQLMARALNEDACREITDGSACLDPFSCLPLNH